MMDKNHVNSPYYDDSHLDIDVFEISIYDNDGDCISVEFALEEDVEYLVEEFEREEPGCDVRVIPCTLRDCDNFWRKRILRQIEDGEDFETIRYYKNLSW